jgi:Protein kinase domain.
VCFFCHCWLSGGAIRRNSNVSLLVYIVLIDIIPARKIANRKVKNPFPPTVERMGKISEKSFTPLTMGSPDCHSSNLSPIEASFRLKLESTQCSPIQSVDDADFSSANDMDIEKTPPVGMQNKSAEMQSPSHSIATSTYSTLCSMSSGTSKSRKLRPMPDISAFEVAVNESSSSTYQTGSISEHAQENANMSCQVLPASPVKALCPPTPLRTPAWALKHALSRSNSLVSNKLLAACPPQVIDEFSSLEDSLSTEEKILANNVLSNALSFGDSYSISGDVNELKDSTKSRSVREQIIDHSSIVSKKKNSTVLKSVEKTCSEQSFAEVEPKVEPSAIAKSAKQSRLNTGWNHSDSISFDVDFDNVSLLGSGAFANVYKARCKSDGLYYAVKRSRQQFRGRRDREQKMTEIKIMQQLQRVSMSSLNEGTDESKRSYCLYLLFFIKAWQEDGYLFCQTELCCRDTCQHLIFNLTNNWDAATKIYPSLTKNLRNGHEFRNKDFDRLVPSNTIWKICHDVSCGLSHIHCHNIVHHDIKPANIFFVHNPKLGALCKIGDFGMAGEMGTVQDGHEGDTAYMPGELLENPKKDPKGDIFSLGITLYELAASGNWVIPREGHRWLNIRDASHLPDVPKERGSVMINLIRRMISPDKEVRPTADEILANNKFLYDSAIQADKFLADYIKDVNIFFATREREAVDVQQKLAQNRRTPTPMLNKPSADSDRYWSVRTPTPGSGPLS